MNAPDEIGRVHEPYWNTKKIVDWKFDSQLTTDSPLIETLGMPVASVNLETRPSSHEKKGRGFVARSRWFGRHHGDEIWADTIEQLETLVERAFRDKVLAHTSVKWSYWIELEIAGHEMDENGFKVAHGGSTIEARKGDARISIEFKILKRAKFPDGRDMVLEGDSLHRFPKAKAAGKERDGDRHEYYQDTEKQYAYIPATPENLEAVKTLLRKIGEVNDRLRELLSQKSIAQTVKLIGGGNLMLEQK